jgi:hypothetical protein
MPPLDHRHQTPNERTHTHAVLSLIPTVAPWLPPISRDVSAHKKHEIAISGGDFVTIPHHGSVSDVQPKRSKRARARSKKISGPEWDCNACAAQPKSEKE